MTPGPCLLLWNRPCDDCYPGGSRIPLLAEKYPYINQIEVYSRFHNVQEINFARRHLWLRHFDPAIVPRWDTQIFREGVLAYLSGAKWRVGFSEEGNTLPRNNEESYRILYTHLTPSSLSLRGAAIRRGPAVKRGS